jgi:hypothetical protein
MTVKYTKVREISSRNVPATTLLVGGLPHVERVLEGAAMPPVKRAGGGKGRRALAAAPIYTLETEPSSEAGQSPLQKLKENRLDCLETAKILKMMCDYDFESPLHRAAEKIENCSLAGAFRSLESGVNNKIGQALCRNRLCPNCQRVLSAKRKTAFMDWLALNEHPLKGFRFYHMVLNVRHSAALKLREGLYTSELLESFANLRGSGKSCDLAAKEWWDRRVSGGVFSVELAPGKTDITAHVHVHVTLFCAPGTIPIYRKDRNSEFVKEASRRWRKLTGDPKAKALFLKPVYYKNEAGEEQFYTEGEPIEKLYKAVSECMKYTLKSDESSLLGYTPGFIEELLTTPNRYFGRFGVLHQKTPSPIIFCELERLNANYVDENERKEKEKKSLYDHSTGEQVEKIETRIGISYFKNTRIRHASKALGEGSYYQFLDQSRVGYLHPDEEKKALQYLARTIRADYEPENDIGAPTPSIE